jgi:hypothetical protein
MRIINVSVAVTCLAACSVPAAAIDLVEAERKLIAYAETLPEIINDLNGYEYGATEDICRFFSALEWDKHIKVLSITIWETENRCTILKLD